MRVYVPSLFVPYANIEVRRWDTCADKRGIVLYILTSFLSTTATIRYVKHRSFDRV